MIIGSGLLARAFDPYASRLDNAVIYAAGVSNSSCRDAQEFERDRSRLNDTLTKIVDDRLFIYFSTCSIDDPWSRERAYTRHKFALETQVRRRRNSFIVRLPQVAGKTANPHTLLNFLYARISRSERFDLWRNATRNIIDVADVARIVVELLSNESVAGETFNIANAQNSSLTDIVRTMEITTSRHAIYNDLDEGGDYAIDTTRSADAASRCGIAFGDDYLLRTIQKYYD
jgi:nucleoside-diphosphate-sugar epimerase